MYPALILLLEVLGVVVTGVGLVIAMVAAAVGSRRSHLFGAGGFAFGASLTMLGFPCLYLVLSLGDPRLLPGDQGVLIFPALAAASVLLAGAVRLGEPEGTTALPALMVDEEDTGVIHIGF